MSYVANMNIAPLVAVCCSVLLCSAVCCNVLTRIRKHMNVTTPHSLRMYYVTHLNASCCTHT